MDIFILHGLAKEDTPRSASLNIDDISKPLAISYDNEPNKNENAKNLRASLDSHGWEYIFIGDGLPWEGLVSKSRGCSKALSLIPRKKIVAIIDSRDVLCLRSPHAFMEGVASFQNTLITSMEIFCDGMLEVNEYFVGEQCAALTKCWNHNSINVLPFRKFINAGLLCGEANAIMNFYEYALAENIVNDQLALCHYTNTFPERVACDVDARILHSCCFGVNAGLYDRKLQTKDSPSLADIFGRGSFFLHFPGVTKIKGQAVLYSYVDKILRLGACDAKFRENYNYTEPGFKT